MISTVYDLPSFVSRGDFHIFMCTSFFNNLKYAHRYITSIDPSLTRRCGAAHVPNTLCRLFCHWSFDVREYMHRLLVFKVIVPWDMGIGVICSDKSGLTPLELLLVRAYQTVMDRMGVNLFPQREDILFGYDEPTPNYEEVGRMLVEVLRREKGLELLRDLQQGLQNHSFVCVAEGDHG